ncbi:HD domain-containing protein [Streptomyces apocyni]|uniref:HD domain-containing protein n=1 Tax=Streptomyces apocyni TaxID=2654677 RepID=UPI001E34F8AB|nr:hypothetical protein [Streptomyces apocyni]
MADLDALRRRWTRTLLALRDQAPDRDGEEAGEPERYADALLARWAEPQRRYHTTEHLAAVLDRVDEIEAHAPHAADPELVRLAAWFHDAIYRPDRSENEERSAQLAERALAQAGLAAEQIAEVARLVRLTVTHHPAEGDRNGEVLCDADLAVLASPPDAYAAYAAAIREEYAFVPDAAFRKGRADVLRQLLGLPRLFHTPYGADRWEDAARHNLGTELRLLDA